MLKDALVDGAIVSTDPLNKKNRAVECAIGVSNAREGENNLTKLAYRHIYMFTPTNRLFHPHQL